MFLFFAMLFVLVFQLVVIFYLLAKYKEAKADVTRWQPPFQGDQPGRPPNLCLVTKALSTFTVSGWLYTYINNERKAMTSAFDGDEQALEILEALEDWQKNPEQYSYNDFEAIFQDRDPFEFL